MTLGFTHVEYGEGAEKVELLDCMTLKFEQEPVYDGLNHAYDRFTIRVSGYFLEQRIADAAQILPNSSTRSTSGADRQTAGTQFVDLRHRLERPRQRFKMTLGQNMIPVNGGAGRVALGSGPNWAPTVILEAKPVASKTDLITRDPDGTYTECQGGPIPKVLSIEHIAGNTAIKVQWEVTVCIVPDCIGGTANDPQKQQGVLSNKWSCADDIDENLYIRSRTFVGELKLARPVVNPHDFRTIVVPPLTPGMRIKSMNFRASEDALTLQYSVIHEEVSVTAPHPATSIRISHRVTQNEFATEIDERLAITLLGPRDVNKQELVILAMHIAEGKLKLKGAQAGSNRLLQMEMADESGTNQQNQITVMHHVRRTPVANDNVPNAGAVAGIVKRFGLPIDGNILPNYVNTLSLGNRPNEKPPTSGPLSLAGAFVTHLQSTCTYDHSANRGVMGDMTVTNVLESSKVDPPKLPDATVAVYGNLQDLPDSTYSDTHYQGAYQTYQMDVQTHSDGMILQLPVSGSLNSSGTGSNSTGSNSVNLQSSATNGDSSAFVRLGPIQHQRTIRIVAQRHGKPPKLPGPVPTFRDSDGVLHVLKRKSELTQDPERLPDGSRMYVIRAEYLYGMSRAPGSVKFGAPDYDRPESLGSNSPSAYKFSVADIYSSGQPIVG